MWSRHQHDKPEILHNRKELIIAIPVNSTNIKEFCKRNFDDPYNEGKVTDQIVEFINNTVPGLDLDSFIIEEVIMNSFDAYAAKGLVMGKQLILKVVIQETEKELVIKIKDNGSGFLEKQKGEYLKLKSIEYAEKNHHKEYLGGNQVGLVFSEKLLQDRNGSLQFKNRKEEGATVLLRYNK